MEKLDKYKFVCDTCNYEWTEEVIGFSYIKWNCPECGSKECVSMLDYIPGDPEFYDRELVLGNGGAYHARK